jgi:tRNA U38,U39,U40 pseudouridine synthase TruA
MLMTKHLQCLRGRHDWQKFETAEGEAGAKCARCGEVDWPEREPEGHGPVDKDWKGYVMPG